MKENEMLTDEQCVALSTMIGANLRAKRLGVADYNSENAIINAMAKLEGAGYQVTLTKAEAIMAVVPKESVA